MSQSVMSVPVRQRALVVEPDQDLRDRVTRVLREQGLEVADCEDVEQGRELFAGHRLVVAPLNGDNTAMKEFVAWIRAEAGAVQPWIIAMGVQHIPAPGETPAHYGVNDLFTGPVETASLVKRLERLGLGHSSATTTRDPAAGPENYPVREERTLPVMPAGAAPPASAAPPSYQRFRPASTAASRPTAGSEGAWDGTSAKVLLNHFPAAVAVLDRRMKYLSVNSRWMEEFQIPPASLTGRSHYEIFPDLHPAWRELYQNCLDHDRKQSVDDTMPRPDGTESLVHWEIQPWHEPGGAVGGLVITCSTSPVPDVAGDETGPRAALSGKSTEGLSPMDGSAQPPEEAETAPAPENTRKPLNPALISGPAAEPVPAARPARGRDAADEAEGEEIWTAVFAEIQMDSLPEGNPDTPAEAASFPARENTELPTAVEIPAPSETELQPAAGEVSSAGASSLVDSGQRATSGAPAAAGDGTAPESPPGQDPPAANITPQRPQAALRPIPFFTPATEPVPAPAGSTPSRPKGLPPRVVPGPETSPDSGKAHEPDSQETASTRAGAGAGDSCFREMAEAAPFGMILLDDEAHVLYANPQHRAVLGFAAETGTPIQLWLDRACSGDTAFQKRALGEWWENVWRRRTALTCSLRNADGLVKDIEFRPAPLRGDCLLLTVFDVTDARLDELAVRASEARYRGLFQQSGAALLMLSPAGNPVEVNPAFESLTGLPRHEARRAAPGDFLPPAAAARMKSGSIGPEGLATRLQHRSGSSTPVHLSTAIIRNEQGQPVFTACLMAPAPEAPSGPDWKTITPDWLLVLDSSGIILHHNHPRDFSLWRGGDGEATSMTGQHLESALPALTAPLPLDVMMERLIDSPGHETRCEYAVLFPGEGPPRRIEARLILMPGSRPRHFGLVLRDVTRTRSGGSPGGFNATLLEHLATPAILTNDRGRILHLNPAAEVLCGYSTAELLDQGLYRLMRPGEPREFSAELSSCLREKRQWTATTDLTARDGLTVPCHAELTPAFDEASSARGFILLLRPLHEECSAMTAASPAPATASSSSPDGETETGGPGHEAAATSRPAAISLHRARNDLQVLTSLITLQADQTQDAIARQALQACRDRLTAVSIVYRLVSHETDPVDFARFARETGRTLLEARHSPPSRITVETLFSSTVLPQRLAVTLGLILEELIVSTLTWSFPSEDATGAIRISLTTTGSEGVLILRDNGVILTEEQRGQRDAAFSCQLVGILAAQLGGSLSWLSGEENQVRVRFRIPR